MYWRTFLKSILKANPNLTDVYQFGVFTGDSMRLLEKIYDTAEIPIRRMFGFDSFEGMPHDEAEKLWNPEWAEGNYSAIKFLNIKNVESCKRRIYSKLKNNVVLISGFFNNVLNEDLVKKYNMKPANYIDIDVNIYSSAKTCLDFCFKYGIAVEGSLIGYDDWGGSPGWKNNENGESRAHKEIEEEYGVKFELVLECGNGMPHLQRVYKVAGFNKKSTV